MSDYKLRPEAEQDLGQIWNHGVDNWGDPGADEYIHQLNSTFEFLAAHPMAGMACDHIRSGYRKQFVGSHAIFYRIDGITIDVVRVLHKMIDWPKHL